MKQVILKKQEFVNNLALEFEQAVSIYVFEYRGLNAATMSDLRKKLAANNIKLKICKNNYLRRAFDKMGAKEINKGLIGPNCVLYSTDNPLVGLNILRDLKKEHKFINYKRSLLEKRIIDAETMKDLSQVTSKSDLIAKFAFGLNYAIINLALTLKSLSVKKESNKGN